MPVVNLDGAAQGLLIHHLSGDGGQDGEHRLILADEVVHAGRRGAVLGVDDGHHGDGGDAKTPILGHAPQGVADGGDNHRGQPFIDPVQGKLQVGLHDGAGEGRQVGGHLLELGLAAPQPHGNHAGGVDQLLGGVGGEAAHHLLALL